MTYSKARRSWSDLHLDQVQCILGRKFFKISTFKQDTEQGIDLFVLNYTFAVRIRQLKYKDYSDFTIRTSSGSKGSEYSKLLSPNAPDYLYYGYALDDKIVAGYLIDLKDWRKRLINGELKINFRRNKDQSHFIAFKLDAEYVEKIT